MLLRGLLAFGLIVDLAAAALNSTLIPPSQDPWYQAPAGFEVTTPGTILKVRPAPGNLTSIYNESSSAYNILYRTTDSNYKPAWAVTTFFFPKKNSTLAWSSLVSFQIPYNSPDLNASPSYSLYFPKDYNVHGPTQLGDIQTLLSYGYFVNVPDHQGPLAAFTCLVSEGHATLDSVRAVRSLKSDWSPTKDIRMAIAGHSGGGIASEFAVELQVQYAPELDFAGAVIGGLLWNISTSFRAASGTPLAAFFPAGFVGHTRQHPDLNQTMYDLLKKTGPYNATGFLAVGHMSSEQAVNYYANQSIDKYFTNGYGILETPAFLRSLNQDAVMGYHGTPQMPLFVYHAIHDELSPIDGVDALVERYCNVGVNILYQRNVVGGHIAEGDNGDPPFLDWLHNLLEGRYNHTGCTTQNVTLNITDSPI